MDETIHLCTLFDSNYLDKGLALYFSIKCHCKKFMLYIFPFDQTSKDILMDLKLKNVEVISLEQFETAELIKVKEKRSKGEYCWTCTPAIIKYVLEHFSVHCCTYIDSDLFFYQSPQVLLNEFYHSGKSVGLVKHRFPNTYYGKIHEKQSGKYCVQFNTFVNDEKGRSLLEKWRLQCLKKCSLESSGDQLYLTDWGEKYDEVYEYQHLGGGVAPWNIMRYKVLKVNGNLYVSHKRNKSLLIFYHFQGLSYSNDGKVNINVISTPDGGLVSRKNIKTIYFPYLSCIEKIRAYLETTYGLSQYRDGCGRKFDLIKFDFRKFFKSFLQKLITQSVWTAADLVFRVLRKRNDVIKLKDVRQ